MKVKIVISSLIMVLMIAGIPFSNSSQNNNTSEIISRFEKSFPQFTAGSILVGNTTTLTERMEHHYVPGVSIAVINDYELDWAKGYGVLDSEGSQPVTPETLFPPASIGKTLTAVAAMHYVELGILDLDQNVNELLTSWKIPENEFTTHEDVTLRRLLSDTAGVSQSGFKGYLQGEEIPTLTQLLDGEPPAKNQPIRVDMVPETQWRYSGGGY
jgi:CubicO group peptidase (beta-lactamase class C family)